MTHDMHDHESVHDVTFVLAESRIADLRASASAAPAIRLPLDHGVPASNGLVARARDAVGRRLISLGGSLVTDEGLRRRALQL